MQINFTADNAFTRKHARLIWKQFFPFYLRGVWLQWLLLIVLVIILWQFISFLLARDDVEWLAGWGLPESFLAWPYASVAFLVSLFILAVLAQGLIAQIRKSYERKFKALVPQESASLDVTDSHVTMTSASATVAVPLNMVTGLALNKLALAIGFSGAGMVIPRSAFATPVEETAFLRAMVKGMGAEAVQRSSESVRKLL